MQICGFGFGNNTTVYERLTSLSFTLSQVHRLVVVDDHEVVKGIVSLSDILQALVLTNGDNGKTSLKYGMVYSYIYVHWPDILINTLVP